MKVDTFVYLIHLIMKRSIATSSLTKSFIESKISQELIVSKYLGIDIDTVRDCIAHNHLIESVFRDDDANKSMGIQYNNKGKLKVRDFGGFGFFDDVYGVVAYVLSFVFGRKINTNDKRDFYLVLKHISMTFSDILEGKEIDPDLNNSIKVAQDSLKRKKANIEIAFRSWNKNDSDLWKKWKIDLTYLNTHFVYPVDQYYINRSVDSLPDYYHNDKDPCYAYFIGRNDKLGEYYWKLYFPLRNRKKNLKFITNCNAIEGWYNLENIKYDYILITKSSKDRLAIGNFIYRHPLYGGDGTKLNIGIINLPSENYDLHKEEYNILTDRVKDYRNIYSLLDFDTTGRIGAKRLFDRWNIKYLFITRGEFGLNNFNNCKDFAELVETYNESEILDFIRQTISYIEIKYGNLGESEIPY